MIAIWRAIHETKARCRHFRSCRNTGACSRATGRSAAEVPKPTKADAQNVIQIVTTDKVKTQAYCDLTKLYDQLQAAEQKNDTRTVETIVALTRQARALFLIAPMIAVSMAPPAPPAMTCEITPLTLRLPDCAAAKRVHRPEDA
jgi:hypothetical protein